MPGNATGGGTAVTRSTLRQQIADALRDEVLAGRLQPGQEFTVKQIADQYGVSATPVREALVDLCAQGLLESDQHRGFKVHRFSVDDYRTMIEARSMVVDGVFRQRTECCLSTLTSQGLVSVRRRAEEAARAARAGDLDILIGYDLRFWRELAALVTNRYISEFLHRLRVQAWVFAVPYLRADPELSDWLWSGHETVVDAVTRGDAERVREEIRAYNAHALAWADRLEAASPPGDPVHARRPHGSRPAGSER
ncbi:GntR family transcriptional regulator [Streptomyces sp. NPDC018833]|uniref:GntR family transcriptional regulator n=1 Tax=Streptomyces sp. NPDC018833 TaxID=3365053 RepID=UPI0037BCC83A